MLKVMRDNLRRLSWILVVVVITFVLALFADWGGQGQFMPDGENADWAAVVDGETVSVQEFLNAARGLDSYYRGLLGDSYDPRRYNLRIGQNAINQLVHEQVMLAHAHKLGLTTTPEEVAAEIVRDPAFRTESGFIGVENYKNVFKAARLDPAQYEDEISRRLIRRKWEDLVTADVIVDPAVVEEDIRRKDETAAVLYAHFKFEDYKKDLSPTDAEIEAFFAASGGKYDQGEGRIFDMVTFDRIRIQDEIEVAEEDVRAHYNGSVQSRFTIPEQRRASHILVRTQDTFSDAEMTAARAAAETALGRVKGGEEFAQVAREISEDSSASAGGDLGFFQKGAMTLPFEQAVWELTEIGQISGLVQTQFGYHVIQLTGRSEARLQPFEEVREEVEREVRFQRSGERAAELAAEFAAAARAHPAAFAEEAGRRTLVVGTTGVIREGEAIPGMGNLPDLSRALFAMAEGEVSAALPTPRGHVVARFSEKRPGGPPPLADIRDKVRADLIDQRAREAARRAAERLAALPAGSDLKKAGEAAKVAVAEATTVSRGLAIGTLGVDSEMEKTVFSAPIGAISRPLEIPTGLAVVQVTSRVELTPAEIAERVPAARRELLASRRQQLLGAIMKELAAAAEVEYNTALIARFDMPENVPPSPPEPPVAR
jgi:peptidyl-prolyl cis-trans isomerase D